MRIERRIREGADTRPCGERPALRSVAWCLAAGTLEAGYFATLARALTRAPLGPVYTIVRGALVVAWPISVLPCFTAFVRP